MKSVYFIVTAVGLGISTPVENKLHDAAAPTVTIYSPESTIIGSGGEIEEFRGIPFAKPPVDSLRLRPPEPLSEPLGTVKAVEYGKACPQFFFSTDLENLPGAALGKLLNSPLLQRTFNIGEDCLSLNIYRPKGTAPDAKLPVLFWIYGGGFELGWSSMYDGSSWVKESVSQEKPIIFVTINYRVGGFGFLPGKEVLADGSSNLGLLDQRLALEWVSDNIEEFGGDPEKVTIWGESAGAISVYDQMVLYDGNNEYKGKSLFRGAIMNSGSIVPTDPVDCPKGQTVYNTVVEAAKCSLASDTLACLREAPYDTLVDAMNSVPGILDYPSVALSYLPRQDGKVLTESTDSLLVKGKFARVPFIIGDQEDEGTIFSLAQHNVTTTDHLIDYLAEYFFRSASRSQLEKLVAIYKDTEDWGSPFRTGGHNNWYPQFKRVAALLGDLTFTLSRRAFLKGVSDVAPEIPKWSYLSSYDYGTPVLGTFHGSDILQVFFGILPNHASSAFHAYYISFVNTLDPNSGTSKNFAHWPQWNEDKQLLHMFATESEFIADDFRNDTFSFILENIKGLYV